MAAVSGMGKKDEDTIKMPGGSDHSWRDILEREGYKVDEQTDVKVAHHAAKKMRDTAPAPTPSA